jgi:TetR/AcrR family transcriptional regulator
MDNRSLILSRALDLWSERGYDAVGVQEIVESAGITKPTLYHYFGSKRGLLDALIDERSAGLRNALGKAAEYRGDLVVTLEAVVRAYFDFARSNGPYYRMQLAFWFAPEHSDGHQAILARNAGQHQALELLFEAAANDHGNMRGRHRAYAATFLGMINTYIGLHLNGFASLDDQLVYQAVHQFMHGIYS